MSKTETQRAKQYTEDLKKYEKPDVKWHLVNRTCHEHKFACQRFLEFFRRFEGVEGEYKAGVIIYEKVTDLKNAIKTYEDAGIK